ncbi:MAG TPA: NAD(P)-dependent oxidoreductase [Micromonospora sp.]
MHPSRDAAPLAAGGRLLVIGGTGFIGTQVRAVFAERGWRVTAVSRRPARGDDCRWLRMDVANTAVDELVRVLLAERPEVVVNAAGAVWNVTEQQLAESNVRLVRRLVRALAHLPWRPRLIHLGSVHEYGPVPPGESIGRDTPTHPISSYGRSKLRASEIVLDSVARWGVDGVVLRVANVSGPGAPLGSLLGNTAAALLAATRSGGLATLRLAPLRARCDFIDVRDVATAVLATASAPVTGSVINIGRGEAVPVATLIEKLIDVSGTAARLVEEPQATSRSGGVSWQRVDVSEARRILGWAPRISLDDSIRALWAAAVAAGDRAR